jgi:hypothetical protein
MPHPHPVQLKEDPARPGLTTIRGAEFVRKENLAGGTSDQELTPFELIERMTVANGRGRYPSTRIEIRPWADQ